MRASSHPDQRPRESAPQVGRPGSVALTISVVAGCLYVVLTVLVLAHLTDSVDDAVRQWLRPDDVWGPAQLRADRVVEGLKPPRVAPALAVVAVVVALVRRSWRPLVIAAGVGLSTGALVVTSKILVARPDPNGQIVTVGGSFPSGHTAVLMAVLGGCLLVISVRTAWWAWTCIVLVDLLMSWCLLVQAAHWFTDVLGGMLLATCVIGLWSWRISSRAAATGSSKR